MKYKNLLKYLIEWGKEDFYLKSIFDEKRHTEDLRCPNIPDELKTEMKIARQEYLEYTAGVKGFPKCTLTDCCGCEDNFYNSETKKCWNFDENKYLTELFFIDTNTPMSQKSGYTKLIKPSCYHKRQGLTLKKIPEYAK